MPHYAYDSYSTLRDTLHTLLSARRFHELRTLLSDIQPADAAQLLKSIDETAVSVVYRLLPKEAAAEIFAHMDSDLQEHLISTFSDAELRDTLDNLFLDDTVDIIEEMPANVVARILQQADPATRRAVNRILHYPKDSAGSIMTVEYVHFSRDMTVTQAFAQIRRIGINSETVYTCYVTEHRRLLGAVTVKDLLIAPPDCLIETIMDTHAVFAHTLDDRETVARQFTTYDLAAIPVVDAEQRIVGIITFDDVMDVLQEEHAEDMEVMAAMIPTDTPYLKTSVWDIWKKRIPWLLLLMFSATVTGAIIAGFETQLAAVTILTAFIPMLMGTGGNAGSQASVTVIRGLSLGELTPSDVGRIMWKEWRVSLLCSATLAAINFLRMWLLDGLLLRNPAITIPIALTVSLAMGCTVIAAKLVGCSLPLLAKRCGFDPAVMASPLITTTVDALSLLIYLHIAVWILKIG